MEMEMLSTQDYGYDWMESGRLGPAEVAQTCSLEIYCLFRFSSICSRSACWCGYRGLAAPELESCVRERRSPDAYGGWPRSRHLPELLIFWQGAPGALEFSKGLRSELPQRATIFHLQS